MFTSKPQLYGAVMKVKPELEHKGGGGEADALTFKALVFHPVPLSLSLLK